MVESHSYEPHLLSLAEVYYYHFYFLIEHLFFYIWDFLQETKLESNWSIVNNEERHISPTPFCPSIFFFWDEKMDPNVIFFKDVIFLIMLLIILLALTLNEHTVFHTAN